MGKSPLLHPSARGRKGPEPRELFLDVWREKKEVLQTQVTTGTGKRGLVTKRSSAVGSEQKRRKNLGKLGGKHS